MSNKPFDLIGKLIDWINPMYETMTLLAKLILIHSKQSVANNVLK